MPRQAVTAQGSDGDPDRAGRELPGLVQVGLERADLGMPNRSGDL